MKSLTEPSTILKGDTMLGKILGPLFGLAVIGLICWAIGGEAVASHQSVGRFEAMQITDMPIIADGIDAWAAENNGIYPDSLTQQLPDGRTVIDFFPDGQLLTNRFTGERSEPSTANWHTRAGNISYNVADNKLGFWLWGWDRADFNGMFGVDRYPICRGEVGEYFYPPVGPPSLIKDRV